MSWFKEYIEFLHNVTYRKSIATKVKHLFKSEELLMYGIFQPTGIMYGIPAKFAHNQDNKISNLENIDKTKAILIDCLINYSLLSKQDPSFETDHLDTKLEKILENISLFYQDLFTDSVKQESNIFILETIIDNRIKNNISLKEDFWNGYFQNSLLFLDIVYFSQWLNDKNKFNLRSLKDDTYFLILKVIAAAANANAEIEKEEEILFNNFMNHSRMSGERVKMANDYFFKGINLSDLDFSDVNSWLIKKYLLEVAILTIWSDRVIDKKELGFLSLLTDKLGLIENDLEDSLVAIESFILINWDKIPFVSKKADYETISENLKNRIKKIWAQKVGENAGEILSDDFNDDILAIMDLKNYNSSDKLSEGLGQNPSMAIFLLAGDSSLLPLILNK